MATMFALRHRLDFRSSAGKLLSGIAIVLLAVSIGISFIKGEPEEWKKGGIILKIMFGLSWTLLIAAVIAELVDSFI